MSVETSSQVFRRAARNVLVVGVAVTVLSLGAGLAVGGKVLAGAAWGAGACVALTTASVVSLALPWHRWPLLAGAGVMVSMFAKFLVAGVLLAIMSARQGSYSPAWFFATFAAAVLGVTLAEVVTLARGRTLVVGP
ncbi:Uncharacterised protein [Actinomyces bovis]|uniref:ATP synthase protein I n=1 Tax=Actinomyces bovis TaxID=1658 RepID=A0ABY1VM98_9ACTO|nr:hypothetical protein [Actinomyces bovis]SPT52802.1 Uncharacterised protein [Actinomyces bovis]VEG54843.1 Uncharacterised protein [Actinomyces israelii]